MYINDDDDNDNVCDLLLNIIGKKSESLCKYKT